jgi:secreted trypsin-like serine protease
MDDFYVATPRLLELPASDAQREFTGESPVPRRRHCLQGLASAGAACLFAASAFLAPAIAVAAKPRARASIVGGSTTAIEAAPFQVALYDPQITPGPGEAANPVQSQYCGGVIINATHVVTAGHCVMDQEPRGVASPQQVEVLAGTNDINTADGQPPGYIEDPVRATSFDPMWEPVTGDHDVGLLTLQNPLWTGAEPTIDGVHKVAPILLASATPFPGSMLTVSGWGYDKELIGEDRPTEEVGFQRYLQSAQVPLISESACVQDYRATGQSVPSSTVCAGSGGHGACYSDSGGPLFEGPSSPPGAYEVLGIVDFGNGCAQAGFPGVFQSLVDSNNRAFVLSEPPQAPLEQSPPGIAGVAQPGRALTCSPGFWSADPSYTYRFYVDESSPSKPDAHTALTSLSPTPTYTVSAADAGQRIFCLARATNAGGYDFDSSPDVTVAGVASSALSNASTRPVAPTLKLVSRSCVHMRCTVNVRASEGTGAAAVTTVRATLSFKRWGACRRRPHPRRLRCLHTLTVKPQVRAIPARHFVIITPRLQAGTYRLTLLAIDKAGVRQAKATEITLVIKQAKRIDPSR